MLDKIKIATCLWFNKNAEEAANFYAANFPESRVTPCIKPQSTVYGGGLVPTPHGKLYKARRKRH